MNLDFSVFVFIIGFVFMLPILGYAFRFNIPISLFFFIAGTFLISILLSTEGIILDTFAFQDGDSLLSHYEVLSRTGQDDIRTGYGEIQAQFVSSSSSQLINDEINCATWHIKKSGSPDSNTLVRYGVWDNSATPMLKYTFGTLNVTNIGTIVQPVKLCNTLQTYTIINADRIGVSWNDGDATNRITIDVDTSNPYDSTITYNTRFNGVSWVANTGTDMQGKLTLEGTDAIIQEDKVMDFSFEGENYQLKVIMIFVSVMFMVGGALVEVRSRR